MAGGLGCGWASLPVTGRSRPGGSCLHTWAALLSSCTEDADSPPCCEPCHVRIRCAVRVTSQCGPYLLLPGGPRGPAPHGRHRPGGLGLGHGVVADRQHPLHSCNGESRVLRVPRAPPQPGFPSLQRRHRLGRAPGCLCRLTARAWPSPAAHPGSA